MPDYPSNSPRFLNEEETILACHRLTMDGIALAQGNATEEISHWKIFKMTVRDWRVWAQCLLFVLVTGAQTMQYFIPTLIKGFGWTGYTAQCKITTLQLQVKPVPKRTTRLHDPTLYGGTLIRRHLRLARG